MATQVQVMCINKSNRTNPHERIQSIGGVHNGTAWKLPEDQAIAAIKRGDWQFYTRVGNVVAMVVIATYQGREYLKTENDGYAPNNLLALPECP